MKKKYGLFKVLVVLLLAVGVVTYFIDDRTGATAYLALGDVVLNYVQSFSYFFNTILFILVVGGFYGVLNKIPAYKKMLKKIANKVEHKSKLFVVITIVVLALVSALTGLDTMLLLVIPMVISVILLLGYDKLVALSATVGSVVVGLIGGIFLTVKDPSNYYSLSYTTIDKLVGLDSHYANLLPKILLLILGVGLLVWYVISHIKNVDDGKSTYELSSSDVLFIDIKEKNAKKTENVKSDGVRVWPLIVVLSLVFIFLVLGYFPWVDLFKLEIFNDFHSWLLSLNIGDYSIFKNLLGLSALSTGSPQVFEMYGAFGAWNGFGSYIMAIIVLAIFMAILALIYRVKFEDVFEGFAYGIKKMIPAVIIVALGYTVLICTYNHGYFETVIKMISDQFGNNAIVHGLSVLLGSVLYVDLYYTTTGVFTSIASTLTDSANLAVYASMFQSLYGLIQIVGPTSVLLIVGLTYLEVPYKTWLKYIWRFVIELLIIILLVLMIVSLI